MSVAKDIKAAKDRFAIYIDRFTRLLVQYNINNKNWYDNLKAANRDPSFVARRDAIWKDILEREGGKLTFGSALAIIGAVLGGAGIAVGGTAFALPPLMLLLPTVGIGIGNEIDEEGLTKKVVDEMWSWFGDSGNAARNSIPTKEVDHLRAWQERMRAPVERSRGE